MATDLETGKEPNETANLRPSLKITGLHIRGLKSIGSLDLPGDGLGWSGPIPDMLMIGGINGSGKTTLLEFLVVAFDSMANNYWNGTDIEIPRALMVSEAIVDVQFAHPEYGSNDIRFIIGSKEFIANNTKENWFGMELSGFGLNDALLVEGETKASESLSYYAESKSRYEDFAAGPAVVYMPSERRTLISPVTQYKSAARLKTTCVFVDRWEPPDHWDNSLEARLYGVRWEDLNAKEEGRPDKATQFRTYQLVFDRFFEGRKQIRWTHRGDLIVETKGGDIHDLSELSSGEKQVILFMGELLYRWRPGSLIVIDEPELHLHESFQTKLWQSLVDWQKERGGQVILATQSDHFFGLSGPGTRVILSSRRAR